MKKWKTILSVLLVFLLGGLAGALGTYKICQQKIENIMKDEPRTRSEFIVQRLSRELHLDSSQLEQLRTIVGETHTEIKNARKQIRPQMEEILARAQDRVRATLRPDQLENYEKIVAERKKKHDSEESNK